MHYLEVPFYKQDTEYTCGPTSLQMVLSYYGMKFSEEHLAHELHTNKRIGTMHQALIDTALRHGLFCYVNNNSTIDEIEYLVNIEVPPIIHFLEPESGEDHYSVIVGLSDKDVILNDPWNGEHFRIPKTHFSKKWTCDFVGNCEQWLLALSPTGIPTGRQYHP